MRLFQKSLDDISNRLSAAESVKNNWTSVSDTSQIPELREYLKVNFKFSELSFRHGTTEESIAKEK